MIFIVSGPSGSGKSTVVEQVLRRIPILHLGISCTTRSQGEGEINGKHYRFISNLEFTQMVSNEELAEWAEVHGKYYGTPKSELVHPNVLLEIDWQGAREIKEKYKDVRTIFVLPPSREEMERRLRVRGRGESEEAIVKRLTNAVIELNQALSYDAWLQNDELNRVVEKMCGLIAYFGSGGKTVPAAYRDRRLLQRVRATFSSSQLT
ncbi:MAG: guanylate kinase [Candidatus Zambryskibacteria bacterium RIFCSPHIGHO2_01_FULL_49_18]|uniref:Guanylate kinase n=2 Tax=Candidatus Zambryskiibacteriota TaxID=1817925 RepID=A0A1G2T2M5_9BACT|nr:MAG: guanylate kinase [Candidatus Zambryskibacteria bacterium RIFCSPHIGHO2_01_FULL_49_18]OHB05687.1 MAG: guanylate kinase [Candidatus Zambryskibacteria bacterium RIFCSPLOWO2_01_FULL_47_14]